MNGGGGDDILDGGFEDDILDGGSGNDTLSGDDGFDVFVLGADNGSDTIIDFEPGQDSFSLSGSISFSDLTLAGNQIEIGDTLIATVEGVDTSSLSAPDFNQPANPEESSNEGTLDSDTINGTDSADRIKGFAGNDVINAFGSDDTVFGDVGDDELDGGSGNDTVVGGVGSDTMIGGAGNDVLVGEEGNDFFVLTPNQGTDTITDFNIESDRFILSGNLIFEELNFNNNSILAGDETIATIEGVDTTELQADNFV